MSEGGACVRRGGGAPVSEGEGRLCPGVACVRGGRLCTRGGAPVSEGDVSQRVLYCE